MSVISTNHINLSTIQEGTASIRRYQAAERIWKAYPDLHGTGQVPQQARLQRAGAQDG